MGPAQQIDNLMIVRNLADDNLRFNQVHMIQRQRKKLTQHKKKETKNTHQTKKRRSEETNIQTAQTNNHGSKQPTNRPR